MFRISDGRTRQVAAKSAGTINHNGLSVEIHRRKREIDNGRTEFTVRVTRTRPRVYAHVDYRRVSSTGRHRWKRIKIVPKRRKFEKRT